MKKSMLVKIIQEAVRAELKNTLPKVINEILSKPETTEQPTATFESNIKNALEMERNVVKPTHTDNPIMNVINETANSMSPEDLKNFGNDEGHSILDNAKDNSFMNKDYGPLMQAIKDKEAGKRIVAQK